MSTAEPVTCRYATPAVGGARGPPVPVLVATVQGELRMIDPRDGKVLWTQTGLEPTWYPLTASQRHVCANVRSGISNPQGAR